MHKLTITAKSLPMATLRKLLKITRPEKSILEKTSLYDTMHFTCKINTSHFLLAITD
jgi:hypothetical protein